MENLIIRKMEKSDVKTICAEEAAQGWHPNPFQYEMRLKDMESGKSIAFIAEYHGEVAGYNNLYFNPNEGAFAGQKIPEVVDLGVFERFQCKGIGSALMDAAEAAAMEVSPSICIGVGLHSGYGEAQRMYIKRGYIPDGSGVWFQNRVCDQYAPCMNDDDLILYLKKDF